MSQVRGVGRRAGDGSQLQVRFGAPWRSIRRRGWEEYWVLTVGPGYSYAVIGNPARTCLWILSRVPRMSPLAYRQALQIAEANHFDVAKLVPSPQESTPENRGP
jgi:apolipoprotein D and lipocalin family protein